MDKMILTGRLGRDPEIRFTKTGKAVCNLSLAVKQRVKRGNGYVDSVTWHRVVLWQGLAEDARSLRQGTAIRIEGFQKSRTFEGRDGETRMIVEIVAEQGRCARFGRTTGTFTGDAKSECVRSTITHLGSLTRARRSFRCSTPLRKCSKTIFTAGGQRQQDHKRRCPTSADF